MTEESDESSDVVRRQSYQTNGPIELDLAIGAGRIDIRLSDEPGVHVEVRHDPSTAGPLVDGLSGLLNWVSDQFGEAGPEPGPGEAVRQTRIDLTGQRLVVRTPKALPLRGVPLAVTIRAANASHLEVRSGTATLTVTGTAGRVDLSTGSGDITVDRADAIAMVNAGSGAVHLGTMHGGLRVRSGSGDLEVSSVGGSTTILTSSGDVWLGTVRSQVMVRTGSGDLTVADAAQGQIELITGSGEVRIGIRQGTSAQVDLVSSSGRAHSELEVSGTAPATDPPLLVRARTGSGDVVVTTAVN